MIGTIKMMFMLCSVVNGLKTPLPVTNDVKISSNVKSNKDIPKFVQEAEIKHGRVAMVSALTIPAIELLNGNHQGIYELSSQPLNFQLGLLGAFGLSEVCQLFKAYEFPMEPSKWFNMKDEHFPGEYSFDPLNIVNSTPDTLTTERLKNGELLNGRIAMLAAFGTLVQELCTDKTVIDTFM